MELSSKQLQAALAQLAALDDVSRWQAARSTMPEPRRERLEELHSNQQREGLYPFR